MKKLSKEEEKRLLEGLRRFREDIQWIHDNYNDLLKKYPEEMIAVLNKEVQDHDPNMQTLCDRMRKEGKEPGECAFEFITTNPPALLFLCS